jgi:RND family efflux transporter MFP subunit
MIVFTGGALANYDWQGMLGGYGSGLNAATAKVRSMAGLDVGPERVTVAPGAAKGPGNTAKGGAPQVTVSKPVVRETIEWDEYTARIDAVDAVDIRARVSGYLNEVKFKDGDDVKLGDLLFLIDPRPFERALEQARAEMEAARTKAENARLDVDRGRPLVDRKIMSEKVFDDRSNALREAQAAIKVAEAKVKTAELDLSFTRVTAPMAGRISRSFVSPGNYVIGGGASSPTLLTTLVSQSPVHIYFDVNENNYLKYKRLREQGKDAGASALGAPVYVALPDEQGFRHAARLDFVDNRLDQATATIRVRALLDNPKGLFSPGMFARVRIAGTAKTNAVLLPDEAILSDQANKFVYVIGEDGTASRRNVVLGPLVDRLRVVRTGVTGEDWVVVRGLQRTRPGIKVAPKREPIKVSDATDEPATRR